MGNGDIEGASRTTGGASRGSADSPGSSGITDGVATFGTTRRRVLLGGVAATALALSACTGVTAPQQGSKGGPSASGQGSGGNAPQGGGSILAGIDGGNPTLTREFNPYISNRRGGALFIYEPLLVINTLDGSTTPFLATSYKQPNPETVIFDIRQGVTWSDGTGFGPSDVLFSFNLLKKYSAMDTLGVWQHLKSVEVKGQQVVMHLKSKDVPAAKVLMQTFILPEHLWKDVKDPVKYADKNPVGTGPYVLGSFSPQQYTIKRNPTYWQADKVGAAEIVFPASNTQLDLVKKGYDWGYAFISDVQKTWVKANPQHNIYWFPPGGTICLYPNLAKGPLKDVNLRRGISLALDRKSIADKAEEGYVQPAGQSGLLLPYQKALLSPKLPHGGAIAQNTQAALQAFSKAGYTKKGNKLVDSSGQQLSLTITTANGYTDWLRGVQEIQRELGAVGMHVTIQQPQPPAYTQALNNGDFQLAMGSFGGTGSFYQDMDNLMGGDFYKPIGTAAAANFERYRDSKTDALLSQLRVTVDEGKQKQLSFQFQQIMYDQLPVISLFYGGLWGLFSTKSFTGWPSKDEPYATPTTWTSNVLSIVTHLKPSGS